MPLLRGALPTPSERLAMATPFTPHVGLLSAAPPSWGVAPPQLSMWYNDRYGDCVSAEEAFGKAAWSVGNGLPELFIADQAVYDFAKANRGLNGAVIEDIIIAMQRMGIQGPDGKTYHDGPHSSVDYTDQTALSAAIFAGKAVKIGVDASPLESALNSTGGKSGWLIANGGRHRMLDHCVALCGYGAANDLFEILKVAFPTGKISPSAFSLLLYTWKSIGVIDFQSMVNITGEAWLRSPTTPEQPAVDPIPTPGPGPSPVPLPVGDGTISIDLSTRTISAPSGWSLAPRPQQMPEES